MKYISLFSGIEAATVAWHPLGWTPLAFAENDKAASAVLAHHYPDVPNLGDVTKFKEWPRYEPDVIIGGSPCQSFSIAGLRDGMADPRGNLSLTYLAILDHFKPRWCIYENVPGILSDKTGGFSSLIGGLAELGYGWAYRVLDAQFFGVAQRRRRVFVVGYLGDWRPPAAVLFERESLRWNSPPRREKGKSASPTLEASAGRSRGAGTAHSMLAPTIPSRRTAGGGLGSDFDCDGGLIAHTLRGEGFDASEDGSGRGTPLVPEISPAIKSRDYKGASGDGDGDGAPLIPCYTINTQIATRHNKLGERTGLGISEDQQSPTIGANHHHAVAIPIQDKATRYKGGGDTRDDDGAANGFGVGQDGDPFPTLGAHDIHAVAFDMAQITSKTNRSTVDEKAPVPTLSSNSDMHIASFKPGQSADSHSIGYQEGVAPSLEGGGGGNNQPAIMAGMVVRRLIPVECERLQGFKDNYTLVPYGKKMMSDSARYKMLGNSMATTVITWLGKRIDIIQGVVDGL